jgi:tRNA threonylcarbamoyladenosine biosynthesis protein TsaB
MLVLALDTTTRPGSVALVEDEQTIEERQNDLSRTHAEYLPGALLALLAAHGLTTAAIDLFAVACGPGSFTGLRIGIATMQGLALVSSRPIADVSTLEALGQLASIDTAAAGQVGAWIDAHRGEVFAALYRVNDAAVFEPERLTLIDGPVVGRPSSMLARWSAGLGRSQVTWIGDGATGYADTIAGEVGPVSILPHQPLAGAIGRIAVARARRGRAVHPAAVRPLYVRRPDAEIDRERRACPTMDTRERKGEF